MELISFVGRAEFRFSPFGDGVNVSAREVHGLHRTYHRHRNHFGRTRWESLETKLNWKLSSVRLEIVLLTHDWSTVCVKRNIGSEIVLEAPDGTPS
jgi:hypothetical protein